MVTKTYYNMYDICIVVVYALTKYKRKFYIALNRSYFHFFLQQDFVWLTFLVICIKQSKDIAFGFHINSRNK